jgi:hypothetical protein
LNYIFKVEPILTLLLGNQSIDANQTLNLTKDFSKNTTYFISCASSNSKPDVNLALFDTKTNNSLSNSGNTLSYDQCDSNNLCTKLIQVSFQFQDNSFDSLNSITCSANSLNSSVPLSVSLQRNVSLTIIGISLMFVSIRLFSNLKNTVFDINYPNIHPESLKKHIFLLSLTRSIDRLLRDLTLFGKNFFNFFNQSGEFFLTKIDQNFSSANFTNMVKSHTNR